MNFQFLILEKMVFITVIKAGLGLGLCVVFHVLLKLVEVVF